MYDVLSSLLGDVFTFKPEPCMNGLWMDHTFSAMTRS